jgi:hypothetical protein
MPLWRGARSGRRRRRSRHYVKPAGASTPRHSAQIGGRSRRVVRYAGFKADSAPIEAAQLRRQDGANAASGDPARALKGRKANREGTQRYAQRPQGVFRTRIAHTFAPFAVGFTF